MCPYSVCIPVFIPAPLSSGANTNNKDGDATSKKKASLLRPATATMLGPGRKDHVGLTMPSLLLTFWRLSGRFDHLRA